MHLGSAIVLHIVRALAAGSWQRTCHGAPAMHRSQPPITSPCISTPPPCDSRPPHAEPSHAAEAVLNPSSVRAQSVLSPCSVRAQAELRAAQVSSMNFWTVGSELGSGLTRVGSVCSDASGSGTWLG